MEYFAGLDVSLEETSICVVDEAGRIVRELRAASEPEARSARSLQTFKGRRCASWLDVGPLPIRRDGHSGQGQLVRRRTCPHGAL
jgi:uncharacterized membrane protein